jgi:hypothetical protein
MSKPQGISTYEDEEGLLRSPGKATLAMTWEWVRVDGADRMSAAHENAVGGDTHRARNVADEDGRHARES